MDQLVTAQGHEVWVRCPFDRTAFWQLDFPAANSLHEALSKVLVDNMITMRAPLNPAHYAENIAAHILADLDQAVDQARLALMPLVEQVALYRKILSGSDYGL